MKINNLQLCFYLCEGTGNPWAGQRSVIGSLSIVLKACKSTSDGNFGLALPTGSTDFNKRNKKHIIQNALN